MPTQLHKLRRSAEKHNFSGNTWALLPMRRRRWIRIAEGPLRVEPTMPVPQYQYGMYGEVTQTVASQSADFGYAGYYYHAPSGLNLCTYRAYNPSLGRWINRDPIGERGGINLYDYAVNRPTSVVDPTGLYTYPSTPSGVSAFAAAAGLDPSALGAGCRDVVNGALGLPSGSFPEQAGDTICWLGVQGLSKARKRKCCGHNVVWGKQGFGTGGNGTEGSFSGGFSPGNFNPFTGDSSPGGSAYNYIWDNSALSSFVGMSAGTGNGGYGYIRQSGPSTSDPDPMNYPPFPVWGSARMDTTMWCSTCKH